MNSRAVVNAEKKARSKDKFKMKRTKVSSKNGRIKLKDMQGKSYMEMGFYKKFRLPSIDYRIIDLVEFVDERSTVDSATDRQP